MSTSAKMSIVFFVVVLCMVPSGFGQPAPAPELDCTDSLTSLLPCLDFVTDTADNVSKDCCTGLGDVRAAAPLCLCQFLGANSSDLGINVTRALQLPAICQITADPSDCGAAATPPVATPTTAPGTAPGPSTTPATPPTTAAKPPTTAPSVSPALPPPAVPTPPQEVCDAKLAELAPCLSFVTGEADPPPSAKCCEKFADVVGTAPTCLCPLLNAGVGSSVPGLNTTLALQLPSYCKVTVNLAECSGTPTTPGAGAPTPSIAVSFASPVVASPLLAIVLLAAVALQLLQ